MRLKIQKFQKIPLVLARKIRPLFSILFIVSIFYGGSSAHAVGVGVQVGTLGLGVELTQSLHRKVNVRFGVNRFSFENEVTQDGVDYTQSLNLSSVATLIDWHPFAGNFRLTGGLLINNNSLELESGAQLSYDIGNETYTTTDLRLSGEVSFQPVMPYLGIGWGFSPSKKSGWSMTAELGIVYMGEADVDLSASGSATVTDTSGTSTTFNVGSDAVFQENLILEEQALENEIDEFVVYPVISLGASFAF